MRGIRMDPITAIAGATAAFNAIKSGFSVGRDIESMACLLYTSDAADE